jgi:hypothetical protein
LRRLIGGKSLFASSVHKAHIGAPSGYFMLKSK